MLNGEIIRGTTPTHEFSIPYPVEIIEDIRVVYGQNKRMLFTKTKDDCDFENDKITVALTQEETFMFMPGKKAYIEVRVKLTTGSVTRNEGSLVLRVIDSMSDEVIE